MNNTNINSNINTQNFWQALVELGKNILSHVNISYNGDEGVIHIDIVPVKNNEIIVVTKDVVEQKESSKMIEDSRQKNNKSTSNGRVSEPKTARTNKKPLERFNVKTKKDTYKSDKQ